MDVSGNRMPKGLPEQLNDTRKGLDNLQRLLGLARRKDWHPMLHSDQVKEFIKELQPKLRGLKTAQRLRRKVHFFYSEPVKRREAWKVQIEPNPVGQAFVPSIEQRALSKFDPNFMRLDASSEKVRHAVGNVTGESGFEGYEAWQKPALAVWPSIHAHILDSTRLSPRRRQDQVALAVFAVATILDDVRFLEWARKKSPQLRQEFSFLPERTACSQRKESVESDGVAAAAIDDERILQQWYDACTEVADIVQELSGDPPDIQRFSEISSALHRLEDLHDSVLPAAQARDRAKQIDRVTDTISKRADEFNAAWLAKVKHDVHAQWMLAYGLSPKSSPEVVRKDVDRFARQLKTSIRRWRNHLDSQDSLRQKLAALEVSAEASLKSEMESGAREEALLNRLTKSVRATNKARRAVIRAVAPQGHTFRPDVDYVLGLESGRRPGKVVAQKIERIQLLRSGQNRLPPDSEARPAKSAFSEMVPNPTSQRIEDSEATVGPEFEGPPLDAPDQGTWELWLAAVGSLGGDGSVRVWNPSNVPNSFNARCFDAPDKFAKALTLNLENGRLMSPGDSLRSIAQYLASDIEGSRTEWACIYRSIIDHCAVGRLDEKDARDIAFSTIHTLLKKTKPEGSAYEDLIEAADQLTEGLPTRSNAEWALEVADLLLSNRYLDNHHMRVLLRKICDMMSQSGYEPPAKRRSAYKKIQTLIEGPGERLQRFLPYQKPGIDEDLRGKKVVIYSLNRSAAVAARDLLHSIQSSVDVRLLDNEKWSDKLKEPVRNADICVMVKGAATHAFTEMMARVRRDAGRQLLVPSRQGAHAVLRAILSAEGPATALQA